MIDNSHGKTVEEMGLLPMSATNESCGKAALLTAAASEEGESLFLGGVATGMLPMPQWMAQHSCA